MRRNGNWSNNRDCSVKCYKSHRVRWWRVMILMMMMMILAIVRTMRYNYTLLPRKRRPNIWNMGWVKICTIVDGRGNWTLNMRIFWEVVKHWGSMSDGGRPTCTQVCDVDLVQADCKRRVGMILKHSVNISVVLRKESHENKATLQQQQQPEAMMAMTNRNKQ